MKRIFVLLFAVLLVSCNGIKDVEGSLSEMPEGMISVKLSFDDTLVKSTENYVETLDEEVAQKNVTVMVFDKETGMLNVSKSLSNVLQECRMSVSVGEKVIWALVNFKNVDRVISLSQLEDVIDDLKETDIATDGLAMCGSEECTVQVGQEAMPKIYVKRMVSRVVLEKLTVNVPQGYGALTLDCVFLGNANTRMTISGVDSDMVNPDGYTDLTKASPIGKDGVTGDCASYMFRQVGKDIAVGESSEDLIHLYCQPNSTTMYTCLYLLTTIGGSQYYYRIPLHNGLKSNTTYSVEAVITNLGSPLPPDGDLQKGVIEAEVLVSGWDYGEKYVVEF